LPPGRALSIWLACLSILLLIFTGAHFSPLGYLLAGILAPLPVLLTGERLGDRAALFLALAGVVFMIALRPGLEILWQNLGFLSLLLMGVLLSVLQHRGISAPRAIIITVLTLNGLALLLLLGQAFYQNLSLQALMAQRGAEIMESVHQVLGEGGGSAATPLVPGVPQAEVEATLQRLLPGLVVTNTGLVAWLNVVLVRQLVLAFTDRKPDPPLYQWVLPEWLIFGVVGAGFVMFIPVGVLRLISINLLLVLVVLYFCQGMAVVAAWFNRLGLPRFLRVIGYPVMFLNPLFILIITLGVLDLWLDFRRLHQQPGDAGGGIES
jgi:uncharacterized protein YybS (DUF2232 family)